MADDDRGILSLIRYIVRPLSWTIHTTTSGTEALQIIERIVPDLVISDILMPHMTGMEFLSRLKEGTDNFPCKVIVISGGVGGKVEAYRYVVKEMGVDYFLEKPFSAGDLLSTIDNVLS